MEARTFAAAMICSLVGLAVLPASAQEIDGIVPAGSRASMRGPTSNFTGSVSVRPMVDAKQMGSTSLGEVTFQPGAHSNWHTHPGGQALYVTEGCGWTQREGGAIVRICKGDTAYVPAGVKHWHGATPAGTMSHISITESVGGNNVNWMEPVTDAQYQEGSKSGR